jgi:Ca2+-binding RTX toxin-like protein
MKLFHYETGASNVSMTGLANANFASMEFTGGAGNYTFDFSGQLQRDASVTIQAGLSNVTLVIPTGLPVQVTVNGLSNVTRDSSWIRDRFATGHPGRNGSRESYPDAVTGSRSGLPRLRLAGLFLSQKPE